MNPVMDTNLSLAALTVGPIQFDTPHWLWLIPILGGLCVLIARTNLSGLGLVTRWVALAVRLLVIALLAGAMSEPSWRKEAKDVAVTVMLDVSDSVPAGLQKEAERYLQETVATNKREDGDRFGVVTLARDPYVQQLPTKGAQTVERGFTGKTDATDIASGVRLALAVAPADAANKLIIVSDGNETLGSVLAAVAAAQASNIPVSILPLLYRYDREVLMDRIVSPATARMGDNVTLKVILNATAPTNGLLAIRDDSGPIDLDPNSAATGVEISLAKGPNTFPITVPVYRRGPMRFEAVFEPAVENGRPIGDTRVENNRQTAVTFVEGEGRVLIIREDPRECELLVKALTESSIPVEEADKSTMPRDMVQMNAYDAIILSNVSREGFTEPQLVDLQRYVRENGGGLMMLGGRESLGAGIWMDTPVAEALPVDLNPPQKKEMPKGCLGIWVHSVEMSDGRFLGQKTCTAAVDVLSKLDLAGIAEWSGAGPDWVHPIQALGDRSAIKRSIQRLTFGDMSDWTPALTLLLSGMKKADAGQKHCILISDGDPQRPADSLLQKFKDAGITITTVAIACHGIQDQAAMEHIATFTGGRFYEIKPNQMDKVPQIFMKEAITVKRPLIKEGEPFTPTITGIAAETFAGISAVPPIVGYVRTAERGGLALITMKNDEGEPLMAQWQYGLGRSVVFASDTGSKWAKSWPAWGQYKQFWSQHARWVMRPGNNVVAMRITPETKGDETLIIVEAMTREGERLSFVNFAGRLASPDGLSDQEIVLREIGPGRYEGRVSTAGSGTYLASLRYRVPLGDGSAPVEGTVSAAINKPFADEYRTLKDNVALLEQVRDKTRGVTLPRNPANADLWNRDGLHFPVATKPIWLLTSVLAISLFLMDVAVRRVRIDVAGIILAARKSMSRAKTHQSELAGLRAAREKAKLSIASRADPAPGDAASVKFEASADELKAVGKGPTFERPAGDAPDTPALSVPIPKSVKADADAGMSALLKAKKRARNEIEDR
jgi:uncharacterized membrane protein